MLQVSFAARDALAAGSYRCWSAPMQRARHRFRLPRYDPL